MSKKDSIAAAIDVEMFQVGKIASISFDENFKPHVKATKEEYKGELEKVVNRIGSRPLHIHVSYKKTESNKDGNILKFTDGYKCVSKNNVNFLYAFSHELTHNPVEGRLIRGVVRERSGK